MAPFQRAQLKVGRANHHIRDLNTKIETFIKEKPFAMLFEDDPQEPGERLLVKAEVIGNLHGRQAALSLIAGDAIHNLRTALDLLAVEMVAKAGAKTEEVYFPFCKDGEALEDMIRRRNIHRAGADVVSLIKEIKPYPGGNDALRAIHDLDIADKHRGLLGVKTSGTFPDDIFDTDVKGIRGFNPKAGQKIDLTVSVLIAKGLPFAEKPVVETLHQFSHLTTGIIDIFAQLPRFRT